MKPIKRSTMRSRADLALLAAPIVLAEERVRRARGVGPGVYRADIRHDEWCPMLGGGRPCVCAPTVAVVRVDDDDSEHVIETIAVGAAPEVA